MIERDTVKGPKTPKELQLILTSVFWSLPTRDAVRRSELNDWSVSYHVKRVVLDEKSKRDRKREKSELVVGKLRQLDLLLDRAEITPFFKSNIRIAFKEQFEKGIKEGFEPTLNMLGVSGNLTLDEGIFSKDPLVRMRIERRFYLNIVEEANNAWVRYNEHPEEDLAEILEMAESNQRKHEEQFFALYNEHPDVHVQRL